MKKEKLSPGQKNAIGLGVMMVFSVAVILGARPVYRAIHGLGKEAVFIPGSYTAKARGYGGDVSVTLTVTSRIMEGLMVTGDKETAGIGSVAIEKLPAAIIAKQTSQVDGISGATATSDAVKKAVDTALLMAQGNYVEPVPVEAEKPPVPGPEEWNDGVYYYEAAEYDGNGFKDLITLEIKDSVIVSLAWDAANENGETKKQLSLDKKYVMSETGARWDEQAAALTDYVLSNQSLTGLLKEDGYTDSVASVSINAAPFAAGVENCLRQAAVNPLADGIYEYKEEEYDRNGFKNIITMEVKDGVIVSVTWDGLDQDGQKKSQLSMDGKYVMTEDGAKWHEQAAALSDYVLSRQSVAGMADQYGYTDAVASVSINIFSFVHGVEDCIRQASGAKGN